jgi:hypothetical protein
MLRMHFAYYSLREQDLAVQTALLKTTMNKVMVVFD